MTDGPITKKFRIWNPAVPEDQKTQDEETTDEKPLDCTSKTTQFQFPEVFQNYLQLAPLMLRLQQQRQMEELARRQFLTTLCHVAPPPQTAQNLNLKNSSSTSTSSNSSTSSKTSGTSQGLQMSNPLVATALGSSLVNENCCAVCGAVFRLTGDLVQHMRNNHRKSKFKRKADFRQ
ncbi:hypothetical protein CRE_30473 [Caenorhabditis remanei]|uniref:C2H2-type domain-containing protein n=1 Tax=Caenorhabditis remanei TaxID=31234 RepID=E3NGI9_CAERE|nr:hypothetical protein CRE_30473 [Caenorhabditis remanei]